MPELPEVESIRRVLKNSLINQKLQKYKIFDQRINRFNSVNPRNLGVLLEINRKGKILKFNFKNISIFFSFQYFDSVVIKTICNYNF